MINLHFFDLGTKKGEIHDVPPLELDAFVICLLTDQFLDQTGRIRL